MTTQADFSHNLLRTKAAVRALSLNAGLRRLRIEGNPFCTTGFQHGTYQIAMQHLLPGMTLLDGKPPSSLASSLSSTLPLPPPRRPPPPGTATNHHHHHGHHRGGPHRSRGAVSSCSPERRSMREGFLASSSLDFVGDLSVERRWRDSAVAGSGRSRSRGSSSSSNGCGGFGTREPSSIRVTSGGGGPTVAPGSYTEIFVAALRKDCPSSTTEGDPPAAAAGISTNITSAAALSAKQKEATLHQPHHQPGQHNNTVPPATASNETAAHRHKRGNTAPAAGSERGIDGGGHHTGGREAAGSSAVPASSLLSYRGLSRAERGAARRRAWSHARQEGTVGGGDSRGLHQQQRSSFRKPNNNVHVSGGGEKNTTKTGRSSTGANKSDEQARSTRGRSPVSRDGVSPFFSWSFCCRWCLPHTFTLRQDVFKLFAVVTTHEFS